MKKYFLIAAISFMPLVCFGKFDAKLFGIADNQFAVRNAKGFYAKRAFLTTNSKNFMFNSNIKTGVKIENLEEDNLKYGANIVFAALTTESGRYESYLQKTFLFVENNLGRIELGNNYTVTTMMSVGPADIAAAT